MEELAKSWQFGGGCFDSMNLNENYSIMTMVTNERVSANRKPVINSSKIKQFNY